MESKGKTKDSATPIDAGARLPQGGEGSAGANAQPGTDWSKRAFDVCFALFLIPFLILPMLVIAVAIKLSSKGPVLHWSDRVGRMNRIFSMPKFRSMRVDSPQVATHLMQKPEMYVAGVGSLLRKTSLDELPNLFSVLKGDLSFVGPRPALFNQHDLVELRSAYGIHQLVPGLTGWAQVNGRDELSIPEKVRYDREYLERRSFLFDWKILVLTVVGVLRGAGVKH